MEKKRLECVFFIFEGHWWPWVVRRRVPENRGLQRVKGVLIYGSLNESRQNSKNERKNYHKNESDNDHTLSLNFFIIFSQRILSAGPKW